MKILVLHPDFEDPGGVAAYYRKLTGKFSTQVDHFIIGQRPGERGRTAKVIRILRDIWLFHTRLVGEIYEIIHLNPSLDPKSLLRDGVFLVLSKFHHRKVVVFFRGWEKRTEQTIEKRWWWLINWVFGNADAVIVLSSEYKRILRSWGFKGFISQEFSISDDDATAEFNIEVTLQQRLADKKRHILFLSRITAAKGIYEVIEAVRLLSLKMPDIDLIIAGDGPELSAAKQYTQASKVSNVHFAGYVNGEKKKHILERAHLICFPTHHGEGMPNSIAESMGFGLPIVTRSVGGIKDFFINRIHGFTTSLDHPQIFADMIESLLTDEKLYREISLNNYNFAQSHLKAGHAARRLDSIYRYVQPKEAVAHA